MPVNSRGSLWRLNMSQLNSGTKPSQCLFFTYWILEHFTRVTWVMWYMKSILRRHREERDMPATIYLYHISFRVDYTVNS